MSTSRSLILNLLFPMSRFCVNVNVVNGTRPMGSSGKFLDELSGDIDRPDYTQEHAGDNVSPAVIAKH
jgi:hypothetical protein